MDGRRGEEGRDDRVELFFWPPLFILVRRGDGPTLGLDGVLLCGEGVVGGAGAPRPAVDVERVQLAGMRRILTM